MKLLNQYGYSRVYRPDASSIFARSGLHIDADGSPRCYHPISQNGQDALANAGHPGNWWGIATDAAGKPYVQSSTDPEPGFYVSTTALENSEYLARDPKRYLDSSTVEFIVIPSHFSALTGAKLGDYVWVYNESNKSDSFAIIGDIGPSDQFGEGSIKLAENLNINPSPRTGGVASGIAMVIFPRSGKGYQDRKDWYPNVSEFVRQWGSFARLHTLLDEMGAT
jgi:hypothetical protein